MSRNGRPVGPPPPPRQTRWLTTTAGSRGQDHRLSTKNPRAQVSVVPEREGVLRAASGSPGRIVVAHLRRSHATRPRGPLFGFPSARALPSEIPPSPDQGHVETEHQATTPEARVASKPRLRSFRRRVSAWFATLARSTASTLANAGAPRDQALFRCDRRRRLASRPTDRPQWGPHRYIPFCSLLGFVDFLRVRWFLANDRTNWEAFDLGPAGCLLRTRTASVT